MKLITIFLIISVAIVCEAQYEWCKENLKAIIHNCAVTHRATQADIYDVITVKWATSEREKCFRACPFHKCNAFTDDGGFKPFTSTLTAAVLWRGDPYRARVIEHTANNCLYDMPKLGNTCDTTEWYLRCLTLNCPVQLSGAGIV